MSPYKCSFRIYIIFYHRRPFNKTAATLVRPHLFSTLCTTLLGKMTLWKWPALKWFCELLGTRDHHGNVKFLVSDELRSMIGHHSGNVITNYIFVKRLWAFMSHHPLNEVYFVPSEKFAVKMLRNERPETVNWITFRSCLKDHVYFNSSLVGVFSGRKLRMLLIFKFFNLNPSHMEIMDFDKYT